MRGKGGQSGRAGPEVVGTQEPGGPSRSRPTRPRARSSDSGAHATRSRRWFSRNARHVGEAGFRLRGMYFATVVTASSMPSFASSLRMRGAPHVTFAWAIRRIRFTTSRSSPGRPRRPRRLLLLQKRLNPSRCKQTTLAGSTMARAFLHPAHRCERMPQKVRSHTPSRSRRTPRVRIRSATCCRSARFSRASSRCVRNTDLVAPRNAQSRLNTLRPYPPNTSPLKAFLADGLLGKHKIDVEACFEPAVEPPRQAEHQVQGLRARSRDREDVVRAGSEQIGRSVRIRYAASVEIGGEPSAERHVQPPIEGRYRRRIRQGRDHTGGEAQRKPDLVEEVQGRALVAPSPRR